jgi:hypothetical protein
VVPHATRGSFFKLPRLFLSELKGGVSELNGGVLKGGAPVPNWRPQKKRSANSRQRQVDRTVARSSNGSGGFPSSKTRALPSLRGTEPRHVLAMWGARLLTPCPRPLPVLPLFPVLTFKTWNRPR